MGRNRFPAPVFDRIQLSDDDWIEVKHELNNGESKKLEAAGLRPPTVVNGRVISPIDWEIYEIERAIIFLTDWSFKGADDKPVQLNTDALKALDIESFNEINAAIIRHVAEVAVLKKSQAEKKLKAATAPPPPSIEKSSENTTESNSGQTS